MHRERQPQPVVENDLADAVPLPPHCEGVARAGRHEPRQEAAADRVEPVGQPEQRAGPGRRGRGDRRLREVLLVDRAPDALGLPFRARVEPAHDSLQVRELLDHLGGEVALRELRRGLEVAPQFGRPHELRQRASKLHDSARLVAIAAELLLKEDVIEHRLALQQRLLAIGLPEKGGVGQPGVQNALVPLADQPLAVRVAVDDGQEMGQ